MGALKAPHKKSDFLLPHQSQRGKAVEGYSSLLLGILGVEFIQILELL